MKALSFVLILSASLSTDVHNSTEKNHSYFADWSINKGNSRNILYVPSVSVGVQCHAGSGCHWFVLTSHWLYCASPVMGKLFIGILCALLVNEYP